MATALLKPEIVNRALVATNDEFMFTFVHLSCNKIVDIAPTVFNHLSKGHNDARR